MTSTSKEVISSTHVYFESTPEGNASLIRYYSKALSKHIDRGSDLIVMLSNIITEESSIPVGTDDKN